MKRVSIIFVTSMTACCLLQTAGAAADNFDGKWTGTINCAKLSFTKGALKVPMEMTVDKAAATYSRDVLNADGSRIIGTEEGTGTIGDGGKLKLAAIWKSADEKPRYTYRASYEGKVSGKSASLKGTQVWSFDGKTENRACTIALKR